MLLLFFAGNCQERMTRESFRGSDPSHAHTDSTVARSGVLQAGRFSQVGVLLLLAASYFLYARATGFPFVYDDVFQIAQNPHLDSWRFLPVYFTQHVWSHVPQIAANFYRPLFLLWLRLNDVLFDREPAGWHSTTILLHLVATGLAYLLARKLLRNRAAASLITALLFGLHPVHTEAVAWVSGVTEPLSTVFFLGSFLCYLRLRTEASHRRLWLAGSLVLFAAALLSKETAAVLPILIVAYELTLGEGRPSQPRESASRFRRHFQELLPYGVLLALYLLVRTLVLGEITHRMTSVPLASSLLTWPWLICFYARQLVWPSQLSPLYDVTYATGLAQARFILPLLMVIGAVAAVGWLTRERHSGLPAFLLGWFGITLAPALLVFCVALPAEGFHDRYLYLPSLALALAAGAIFGEFWESPRLAGKTLAIVTVLVISAALALSTHRQIGYWASNYVLFERAVNVAPRNEIANLNFASELLKNREYGRALQLSEGVISAHPESARALASAAAASSFLRDYRQAEAYYARAVQIDPSQGTMFLSLGLTRMRLGLFKGAQDALRQALMVDPTQPGVHYALGLTDMQLGEWLDARNEFQTELQDDPANDNAQKALLEVEKELNGPETKPTLSDVVLPSSKSER